MQEKDIYKNKYFPAEQKSLSLDINIKFININTPDHYLIIF